MRARLISLGLPIALCLALASCSPARQAVIRNATAGDIVLWPLGEMPTVLKSGETSEPVVHSAHRRHEALIKRGNCLYTYPAPEYSALPKAIKNYKPITVVIHEDMRLSLHRRKDGVEGPEILVAGFPLRPTTFCGAPRPG
jgi:hypothetical protein